MFSLVVDLSCVTYISKIQIIILKIRFNPYIMLEFLIKLLVSKSLISYTYSSQFYFHLASVIFGPCVQHLILLRKDM